MCSRTKDFLSETVDKFLTLVYVLLAAFGAHLAFGSEGLGIFMVSIFGVVSVAGLMVLFLRR